MAYYDTTPEKVEEIAVQVLERIEGLGLPPTPNIYELWYVYYGGLNADVTRAIDVLISNNIELDAEKCIDIHNRFLSDIEAQKVVQRAGELVDDTIQDVTGIVEGVKSSTNDYSGSMNDVADKLSKAKTQEEMQSIMQSVMAETKKMIDENRNLESKLNESSSAMSELQEEIKTVRREAMTDGLTGLPNRKRFDMEIGRMLAQAKDEDYPISMLMMDIDFFKSFNDNYGHQVGDQVLRLVARTLHETVKGKDLPARYGGEEFCVILPQTELRAAEIVGNAIREAVAGKEVINRSSGEKLGRITISAGAAQLDGEESSDSLISRADAALYQAKDNGRNRVEKAPMPSLMKRKA